jgi:sarcosine oxidase
VRGPISGRPFDAEVAVIGVGSTGSMALWQLARRGVSALGFEQFTPGHDRAATGGESRVFRIAYHEGASYVPLLLAARDLWGQLEEAVPAELLDRCGYLEIAKSGDEGFARSAAGLAEHGLPHEVLAAEAARDRFPQHRFRDDDVALFDPLGGTLRPEYSVVRAARLAESLGARVLRNTRVERIDPGPGSVTVRTASREWRFRRAVVTAGSWANRLLPELDGLVEPRRLSLTWFPALDPARFSSKVFPAFGRTVDGLFIYGAPVVDGRSVKVSFVQFEPPGAVDPDHLEPALPHDVLDRLREIVREYLPGLVPDPVRLSMFADGFTPDGDGLVGLHPGHPSLVIVAGLSGHGFKLAPLFGKVAADLAVSGETPEPVGFLGPARFLAPSNKARTAPGPATSPPHRPERPVQSAEPPTTRQRRSP